MSSITDPPKPQYPSAAYYGNPPPQAQPLGATTAPSPLGSASYKPPTTAPVASGSPPTGVAYPYGMPPQPNAYPAQPPGQYAYAYAPTPAPQHAAYYNYGVPPPNAGGPPTGYGVPPGAENSNQYSSASVGGNHTPNAPAPVAQPAYFDYTAPASYSDVQKWEGSNKWATSMCCAPCAEPCFFCASFWCPCCCVWMQRKKLLVNDWSRYICCAGLCGNCRCCVCRGAEPCCMCMEAVLCLACAVHGNRFMVMQHYNLETECCDMVIMCLVCILQILAAILQNDLLKIIADCSYNVVLGCILAQNEHQMKKFGYPRGQNMH